MKQLSVYQMCTTALMTALLCVLGPWSIQIGTIPVSFTMLAVYLSCYLVGMKFAAVSCALYLLLGTIGLPVFSGFQGGVAKVVGPTGGYLVGFLVIALVAGFFIEHFDGNILPSIAGMVLGIACCYILGTVWFIFQSGYTLQAALAACVYPFLLFDAIKILLAALIGPVIRNRLKQAHLL